ncbi:MAG TPA: hypothetical protein VNQ73_16200 [Ilumatobacter sp.]|nr:hypothetical protein [Ilumatobacter sp.]
MSVFVFGSLRGSPGVTTAAVLAAGCFGRGVLVEADGDGGVLALRHGLHREPGLVTLAGSRGPGAGWESHTQLVAGVPVLVGPESPERMARLWAHGGERLVAAVTTSFDRAAPDVVVDAGRLRPGWPPAVLASVSRLVVFVHPVAEELAVLAQRLMTWPTNPTPIGVVLAGAGPYRPGDVSEQLGVEVLAAIPIDRRAGGIVNEGGSGRVLARSSLARAARSLAERLVGAPPDESTSSESGSSEVAR